MVNRELCLLVSFNSFSSNSMKIKSHLRLCVLLFSKKRLCSGFKIQIFTRFAHFCRQLWSNLIESSWILALSPFMIFYVFSTCASTDFNMIHRTYVHFISLYFNECCLFTNLSICTESSSSKLISVAIK